MLHRSFKPAKCKTALKLVVSRSKLLKNKKEVAVKQLKRELAQLLEHGQEQTARIRVEHVVREEKMMAAYELIEIFCELIAVRLPIIESQKNCPIDLKEAVTSIIFAAPRCSDIPELADVRKHFTAKYGKEFVTAAIELRPDCGVNRNLVEKLSAKAPDGPTKVKILTAIAQEHNITWDAKSFGEKDSTPQEDLLNGPKPFENASSTHVESSNVQASYYDRVSPDVHISPENEGKQEGPINYHGNISRSSFSSQNVGPTQVNASAAPSPNLKPSGNGTGRMESRNSYSEEQNPNFVNRQNWNMEFTDATSAAQAAAESAERASMAARAAAELSSRGPRGNIRTEYSPPSQSSSAHASRDEMPRRHSGSSFDGEAFTRGQMSNNSEDRNSRSRNEEIGTKDKERHNFTEHSERLHGDANTRHNRPNEMPSAASTSDSSKGDHLSRPHEHRKDSESSQSYGGWNYQDQTSIHEDEDDEEDVDLATLTERLRGGSRPTETGSRPSSSKKTSRDSFSDKASRDTRRNSQDLPHPEDVDTVDEFHMRRQSQKFEVEHSDETQDVFRTEKATNLEDEIFRLRPADAPAYSRSSSSSSVGDRQDDVEHNSQNVKHGVVGNPFAIFDGGKYYEGDKTTKESGSVQFDDYDSDGENAVFDLDKGPETSSHIFSPDRKPTSYPSEDIYVPSPRRNRVDLFGNSISESPSRGRSSASVFSESVDDSAARVHDELPPVKFDDVPEPLSESEEEPQCSDSDREDILFPGPKKSQFNSIGKGSAKFDEPVNQPHHSKVSSAYEADDDNSLPQKSAFMDDSETLRKSSSDSASEFSFGKLTGGLRNRGYMHPPYVKSSSGEASLSKQAAAGEMKESRVSDPPKTWSSSEIADDSETPKRTSPVGTYRKSSLGEASAARTSLEDTAKRSSFPSAVREESIDYEVDLNTRSDDAEYKTLSGRREEKPLRSSSVEAPLSKQAPADASMKYGFSSPPRRISVSRPESDYSGVESAAGKRSSSRDTISFYESQQSKDPKEEVASPVTGSEARYGAGLSRRTKSSPSKTDGGSHSKSPPAPKEEKTREQPLRFSSRSSDNDRRSQVKPMYRSEEGEVQESRTDRESSSTQERRPDTTSYSTRRTKGSPSKTDRGSPLKSSSPPKEEETREPSRFSSRSSDTDRRSQVKSMHPSEGGEIKESRAYRESSSPQERRADTKSSSRSSYSTEAHRTTRPERPASDNKASSYRLQPSREAMEKPKSETQKSSERPSGSPQMPGSSVPSASSQAVKPSLEDTSRENSFNRASHVHPKLPDYDTIAALLRGNRK